MTQICKILVLLVLLLVVYGSGRGQSVGLGMEIGHYNANGIDNGLRYGLSLRLPFGKWEGTVGGGGYAERDLLPTGGYLQFGLGYSVDTGKDFFIVPGLLYHLHLPGDSNLKTDSFIGPRVIIWHVLGIFRYGGGFQFGYMTGQKIFIAPNLTFSFDL